jgi:hypothetical protein
MILKRVCVYVNLCLCQGTAAITLAALLAALRAIAFDSGNYDSSRSGACVWVYVWVFVHVCVR